MRISDPWFHRLLDLLRPRAKRLTDFVDLARPFLSDTVEYEAEAIEKHLGSAGLGAHVEALAARCGRPIPSMSHMWKLRCEERQLNGASRPGMLIHATRVAVTGRTASPGLFEVLALLGRERTVARLERLVNFLATAPRADFS